ncbi:hypothetical protein AB1K70_04520 [Bremerella sp. JC770]|uniref:hypothetical protein n=1 Tax=Bremerella sp. JC770 TaxID=3232137 RepID=UPI00345A3954
MQRTYFSPSFTAKPSSLIVAAALLLTAAAGCSRDPFACVPVSGMVTLDGEPLKTARVIFTPERKGDSAIVGPISFCITDDQGQFALNTTSGKPGAMIGNHKVFICGEVRDEENPDVILVKEYLPRRYYEGTELTYEVSGYGTDEANFALTSK